MAKDPRGEQGSRVCSCGFVPSVLRKAGVGDAAPEVPLCHGRALVMSPLVIAIRSDPRNESPGNGFAALCLGWCVGTPCLAAFVSLRMCGSVGQRESAVKYRNGPGVRSTWELAVVRDAQSSPGIPLPRSCPMSSGVTRRGSGSGGTWDWQDCPSFPVTSAQSRDMCASVATV